MIENAAAAAVREVLRNRAIRRIEAAWALGIAADWAFLVVLLVVVYEEGGTLAVGILGAVRVLPAIVAAPFASTLVERFRGDRVLTAVNIARSGGALATALVLAAGPPTWVTYVLAALVAGAGALVRPIQLALLPALARTPGELVAANVASSMGEGLGTFIGPLLAGVLVASTGSVPASVLVAVTFAGAAAAATGVRFERETDARGGVAAGDRRFRLADAPAVLRRYPHATLVMGDFVVQIFVRGMLITLIVVASIELLDMGDGGVGLLNAAIGLGGLAGAIGALALAGGARLPTVFALALVGWGLPLMLIGAWPVVLIAFAALFVTGLSNAVLDVAGFTLMQRGVSNEDRVTIFGVMEAFLGLGLLAGSLVSPALVAAFGARGALVAAGAVLPLLALATWRPIMRGATRQEFVEERLALLRRNTLFAPLPLTALDRLAEDMRPVSFEPGEVLMRKGEPGERYVLIERGEVDVHDEDTHLGTYGPGEGVGEIALVRKVPRTATVTALTEVEAYEIDASTFLAALAGPAGQAAAESVAAERLANVPSAG